MSEVNLTFVVDSFDTTFTVEKTDLTFSPTSTELAIYTGGYATAAGSSGQVQFNNSGTLAGDSRLTFNSTTGTFQASKITATNLTATTSIFTSANITSANITTFASLGNVANVKIQGGSSGQYLKTDGTGNISFAPLSATGLPNTFQYNNNGNLAGATSVTYENGNLYLGYYSNVKMTGGSNGQFLKTDGTGNLSFANPTATPSGANTQIQYNNNGTMAGVNVLTYNGSNLSIYSNDVLKMGGGDSGQVLSTDGSGNLSWITPPGGGNTAAGGSNTQLQFNNAGVLGGMANFTYNSGTSILTLGGNVNITGTPTLNHGRETVYASATSGGTYNVDILTNGAISWFTGTLGSNFTVNMRGDGSTTFLSTIANYQSVSIVVVTTVGSSVYYLNGFSIDGTTKTVKWVNGSSPNGSFILPNSTVAYTFTITRLDVNNFTILGSFTGYQ